MSTSSHPPSVWVGQNRWVDIPVPALGEWTPDRLVSVVIPYYERPNELAKTLAGLSAQSYPHDLLEVIIADDGSTSAPATYDPYLPFQVKVVRQPDTGFGAARARNLGARTAEGDFLVFLDCDMIPERQHIEAHARWHHSADFLCTVGFRIHADFASHGADEVARAVFSGSMDELASGEPQRPEWIEGHMSRTDNLLGPTDDFYRITSSGNLGVDKNLFDQSGGFNETFERWGGEDNEFGFRLIQLGAVVVPERLALAWHQGPGHEADESERHSLWLQRPKMDHLIADRSFRTSLPGRIYENPLVAIHLDLGDEDPELISVTIDSILAADFTDFVIGVGMCESPEATGWLHDTYDANQRVLLGVSREALWDAHRFSLIRVEVSVGVVFEAQSLRRVIDLLGDGRAGAVHVTIPPGENGSVALMDAYTTRAFNRATRLTDADVPRAMGELFGERWVSGRSLGIHGISDLASARSQVGSTRSGAEPIGAEVDQLMSQVEELSSRRALRISDGLGTVARARSAEELRLGLRSVLSALRSSSS